MMNVNLRRDTLLDHVSDVSNSDIMINRLDASYNGIDEEDDIHNLVDVPDGKDDKEQSLEQIVELHARKKNYLTNTQLVRAQSSHVDTGKTVLWCLMEIECKQGLVVALDDDFTENYDEFALGLVAKEFSMVQSYLYSDVCNKFRADQQFEQDRDVTLKQLVRWWDPESGDPYPLKSALVTWDTGIKLDFEVNYFNKATFCLEPLVEPYQLHISQMQEMPLSQYEQCID